MFGKLMKYELRGCMRVFLPLWGATLALALINGLTNGFQPSISAPLLRFFLQVLPALLLFGLSFGMFVMAFVLIIRRFFSGLLGDGGYLAFSLPATYSQHIASKLLTALIMLAGCLITGLLATVLIIMIRGYGDSVKHFITEVWNILSSYPKLGLIIFEAITAALLSASYTVLRLYSGMAVGHLFGSHRALWSLGAVIGIGWILNLIFIKAGQLFFTHLEKTSSQIQISINTFQEALDFLPGFFGIMIAFFLVGNVILWLATWLILRKKLNIL